MDVSGIGVQDVPRDLLADILDAYHRSGFKAAFREVVLAYCRRKTAAQLFTWTDNLAREGGCPLHGRPLPTLSNAIDGAPFTE